MFYDACDNPVHDGGGGVNSRQTVGDDAKHDFAELCKAFGMIFGGVEKEEQSSVYERKLVTKMKLERSCLHHRRCRIRDAQLRY